MSSNSSKEWKAKIHKQHQDESRKLSDSNVRYDNKDSRVKSERYGTHKARRAKY